MGALHKNQYRTNLVPCKEARSILDRGRAKVVRTNVVPNQRLLSMPRPRPRPDLPTVELCLRLDEPTHRQLTAEAKRRSVRSLQGEIIFRLRKSLDQPEGAGHRHNIRPYAGAQARYTRQHQAAHRRVTEGCDPATEAAQARPCDGSEGRCGMTETMRATPVGQRRCAFREPGKGF